MENKKRKVSKVNFLVKEESRKMLDELSELSGRSMTGVIENLIKIEYHRVKESSSRWVP